jgi:general secretion pathway protein B
MSLILDALKRAERERKLEKAPDLSAIYQEGRQSRRNYYPWFWVGGGSLAAFVVLAFLFWPKEPSNNIKDKTAKATLTASAPAKQLPPKGGDQQLSTAEKPGKKAVISAPVSGGEDKRPKIGPKSAPSKAQTSTPQKNSTQPLGVNRTIVSLREKLAAEPVKQFVAPRRAKDRPKVAAAVVPPPKPKVTLPAIHELPEDIQSALGPLEINVHMYSQNPSERRVFINMKGYREGDTIGESGFKLTEITPYGVVIDYGKGKAALGVKHK